MLAASRSGRHDSPDLSSSLASGDGILPTGADRDRTSDAAHHWERHLAPNRQGRGRPWLSPEARSGRRANGLQNLDR
jgi:hypothetical protein